MSKDTLTMPVPYTLEMLGTGSFVASWEPVIASNNLPPYLEGRSSSSGIKALQRLYGELLKHGVVEL